MWSREVFFLLVENKELRMVYPLSIIILMGYNYRPMYFYVFTKINYYEKTGKLWRISFMAGIINVALNLLLIPFFGYTVAAYTTFACMMYMGYSGFMLKSFREMSRVKFYPVYWLLLTILLTAIAYFLVESPIEVKAVSTVIVGFVILWLFQKRKSLMNKLKAKK